MPSSAKKLLIVDDIDLVRDFLKDLFAFHDVEMEVACNGQEAFEIWARDSFGAILMDLDMPVMGGIEAARIIRKREKQENRRHTPIFAVSGQLQSLHDQYLEAGVDGCIAKPIDIDEILGAILPLVN